MDKYRIVRVTWVDAEEKGEIGWNSLASMKRYAKKPCPVMVTVGQVIYQDDDHISLLSSIGPQECSSMEKIPIAFVKSIEELLPDQGTIQKKNKDN